MMLLTLYHDSILLYFNKNILSFVFSTGYFGDIFRINSTQNDLLGIVRESWKEGKGRVHGRVVQIRVKERSEKGGQL